MRCLAVLPCSETFASLRPFLWQGDSTGPRKASPLVLLGGSGLACFGNQQRGAHGTCAPRHQRSEQKWSRFPRNDWICGGKSAVCRNGSGKPGPKRQNNPCRNGPPRQARNLVCSVRCAVRLSRRPGLSPSAMNRPPHSKRTPSVLFPGAHAGPYTGLPPSPPPSDIPPGKTPPLPPLTPHPSLFFNRYSSVEIGLSIEKLVLRRMEWNNLCDFANATSKEGGGTSPPPRGGWRGHEWDVHA